MKFIVEAQKEEKQNYKQGGCMKAHTLCGLCSEDPRFCVPI